jgi:hypothetical protein
VVVDAPVGPVNVMVAPLVPAFPEIVNTGAVRFNVKLCDDAPEEAVSFAVWLEEIEPTVAVKRALEAPDATVTDGGTLAAALLLPKVTASAVDVAPLSVTVQDAVPGAVTVAGLQERPLTVGTATCAIVIAPPFAVPGTDKPAGDDMLTPVT